MGRETKKIDAKGRFFLSTKLKESMGKDLVVTNSLDVGYLCVYTRDQFDGVKKQINSFDQYKHQVRTLKRVIIGEAEDVSVDSQGRISVSQQLWDRIEAKPGDEICLLPNDGKIEICTKDHYDHEDLDLSQIEGLESLLGATGL